jgi:uncharacterized protein
LRAAARRARRLARRRARLSASGSVASRAQARAEAVALARPTAVTSARAVAEADPRSVTVAVAVALPLSDSSVALAVSVAVSGSSAVTSAAARAWRRTVTSSVTRSQARTEPDPVSAGGGPASSPALVAITSASSTPSPARAMPSEGRARARSPLRKRAIPVDADTPGAGAERGPASVRAMRILALADAAPHAPIADLVGATRPELVVLLGDLEPAWIDGLEAIDLPKLGVRGNHDAPDALRVVGAEELQLRRVELGGLSFAGFGGSPRYSRNGGNEWTEEEAAELVERLPAADVLLTHSPPAGVNDDPEDPVHRGSPALREWVERHRPAWLLHGHTVPLPGHHVHRLGSTRVVHVRGAATLDLGEPPDWGGSTPRAVPPAEPRRPPL